jgi:ArsR family transcriptional regulator
VQAELVRSKRIKQWTFYKRDEVQIGAVKQAILENI